MYTISVHKCGNAYLESGKPGQEAAFKWCTGEGQEQTLGDTISQVSG